MNAAARTQILLFTITMVGVLGCFNGLNALGGGGLKDHLVPTKMQTIYSVTLCLTGWLGGRIFNRLGPSKTMTASGSLYCAYVLILIGVTFYAWSQTLAYVGGALVGCGATLMWTCFGVFSINYPVDKRKGFLWLWCALNVGSFLLGCYGMFQKSVGGLPRPVYWVLLGVMAVCTAVGSLGLAPRSAVIRSDGSRLSDTPASQNHPSTTFAEDMPVLMLLVPLFLTPNAHYPFLFNGLNVQFFNVRSRSFNTAVYSAMRIPGAFAMLRVFDHATTTMVGIYMTALTAGLALIVAHLTIFNTFGNVDGPAEHAKIDAFTQLYHSTLLVACFVNFALLDSVSQTLIYQVLAHLSQQSTEKAAIYSGLYKGLQAVGLGAYWALDWALTTVAINRYSRYRLHWLGLSVQWAVAALAALVALLQLHKFEACRGCGSDRAARELKRQLCTECQDVHNALS